MGVIHKNLWTKDFEGWWWTDRSSGSASLLNWYSDSTLVKIISNTCSSYVIFFKFQGSALKRCPVQLGILRRDRRSVSYQTIRKGASSM